MDKDALKALQAPIKERYRAEPDAAVITLRRKAPSTIRPSPARLRPAAPWPWRACIRRRAAAGLNFARATCCLEALVACAGVTLKAVATALGISLSKGIVRAEGDLDFRGTLGVDKEAPVGFKAIRLAFDLETDAPEERSRSSSS